MPSSGCVRTRLPSSSDTPWSLTGAKQCSDDKVIHMNNRHPNATEENRPPTLGRREFLTASAGAVAAALLAAGSSSLLAESRDDGMIYRPRPHRRTRLHHRPGWLAHRPAFHFRARVDSAHPQAIDRGITFMDNCWDYNEGASEVRMGKALGRLPSEGLPDGQNRWPYQSGSRAA